MIKPKELEKLLKPINVFQQEQDKLEKALCVVMDNPIIVMGEGLLNAYITLLQDYIGDTQDSIYWFIYDNDWGANKYKYSGIKVKTAADLVKAMEVVNKGK